MIFNPRLEIGGDFYMLRSFSYIEITIVFRYNKDILIGKHMIKKKEE